MKKQPNKGFGLIEILAVLLTLAFIFYGASGLYFKQTIATNKELKKTLSEEGIDTTNYNTILDSAKEKIKDLEIKIENQYKVLEKIE